MRRSAFDLRRDFSHGGLDARCHGQLCVKNGTQQFKIWPVSETRVDDGKHLLPRTERNPIFGTPLMNGLLAPLQIRENLLKSRVRRVRLVGVQIIGEFGRFRPIARSRSAQISEEDISQGWSKMCALEHHILNRKQVGGNTVNNSRR